MQRLHPMYLKLEKTWQPVTSNVSQSAHSSGQTCRIFIFSNIMSLLFSWFLGLILSRPGFVCKYLTAMPVRKVSYRTEECVHINVRCKVTLSYNITSDSWEVTLINQSHRPRKAQSQPPPLHPSTTERRAPENPLELTHRSLILRGDFLAYWLIKRGGVMEKARPLYVQYVAAPPMGLRALWGLTEWHWYLSKDPSEGKLLYRLMRPVQSHSALLWEGGWAWPPHPHLPPKITSNDDKTLSPCCLIS